MSRAKILVDSCFWIALYSPEDSYNHVRAWEIVDDLENNEVIIPWPTLYEFVNTRLARRKENLFAFEQFLLKPNITKISDNAYRQTALENVFELNVSKTSSISLIDEILRLMIQDVSMQLDYVVTFNKADFEYTCQMAGVLILD